MNGVYRHLLFDNKKDYHIYIGKDYSGNVQSHHHDFYQCTLIISGRILQNQNGLSIMQLPGEIFFTPPKCSHWLHIFDEDTQYFCLSFSQNIADIVFNYFPKLNRNFTNLPPIIKPNAEIQTSLEHCFSALLDEQFFDGASPFRTGHYLAVSSLIMILRKVYCDELLPDTSISHNYFSDIFRCIQYINDNYDQELNIDELIRISSLSRSSLYRLFKQYTGKSISQFIIEKRIGKSMNLMADEDKSISEIAHLVGFDDFSTFYRNFLKLIRMPPSQYRAMALSHGCEPTTSAYVDCLGVCNACRQCLSVCMNNAIRIVDGRVQVNPQKCNRCGECSKVCSTHIL